MSKTLLDLIRERACERNSQRNGGVIGGVIGEVADEVTVCSCPAQYHPQDFVCICSVQIPRDPAEVEAYMNARMDVRMIHMDTRMDVEALQAAGVCPYCGCIEEDCECEWRF